MTNDQQIPNEKSAKRVYDLEERTLRFSKLIIDFSKQLPFNYITKPLINQLIKAGTSIGANYCEADEANSKRDFLHKISISKKETKETKYWLKVIVYTLPTLKLKIEILLQEAQELNLIFAAILRNAKQK